MLRKFKKVISIFLTVMLCISLLPLTVFGTSSISVNELSSPEEADDLINALLGGGVAFSNVSFKGSTGEVASAGTFSGGTGIFGFEGGIVLSSGYIANIIGPNNDDGITATNSLPGDADLESLILGTNTKDATVLEFDFVPNTSEISFQYQFASDEYNEYVGQYNDVFGFFVNGENIALIPGTTTVVSINNINSNTNSSYYINNDLNDVKNEKLINTEMDGLTVALTAKASVNKGVTNHIKLAIADAVDSALDSNVLIKAGSFVSDGTPPVLTIPDDVTVNATGEKTVVDIGTAAATDDTTPTDEIIITNNAPSDGFLAGTTAVVWTATDLSGNSTSLTQYINVLSQSNEGKDYAVINWMYETGYNTETYNLRYTTTSSAIAAEDIGYYKNLHYDSGYTFVKEDREEQVVIIGETSSGTAITGTAIKVLTLTYDRNSSGGGNTTRKKAVPIVELEKLDHFAYVIGYPEGDVRPLNNITREEVAMIFYRLLTDESRNNLLSEVNPFTDLENHEWSNRAISTLFNAGLIKGYPDGTFKPSDPISRAEFATIAAKFDKLELSSTSKFTDIFGHWAEKYITSSEIKGWIKGYPDLTFKPEQDITRAEAMTLINNVLERAVPEENIHPDAMFWQDNTSDKWYYEAVMEATNSHDYIYEEDKDELWTGMKANKVWP